MTVLDPFVQHLADAAERLAAQPAAMGARGRIRARLSAIRRGRLATFAAAATLLAGGAAAATELWRPQLGDERRGNPTASASSPVAEQLARFGVLRRDANPADRSEQVRYALSMFGPRNVQGIRTEHVRLVGTHGARLGDVLVPAARADGKRDVLCLFSRDPKDGGGVICSTTAEILAGRAILMTVAPPPANAKQRVVPVPQPADAGRAKDLGRAGGTAILTPAPSGPATLLGFVPDGVSQVRQSGATAAVRNNYFRLRLPREAEPAVQWLDADGAVVGPPG
ncbi:MAG: hypothetical protein Q8O56_10550 [Solirubrobacteraceae bacterium]|nr:hypothetical protein [Solirubrobacteraceae bacterium]